MVGMWEMRRRRTVEEGAAQGVSRRHGGCERYHSTARGFYISTDEEPASI